jgi:hypothetical protein
MRLSRGPVFAITHVLLPLLLSCFHVVMYCQSEEDMPSAAQSPLRGFTITDTQVCASAESFHSSIVLHLRKKPTQAMATRSHTPLIS